MSVAVGTVVLLGVGRLAAQGTTGKIEGTVRDQSGAPIAGAQVLIVGSSFSGVSNEQGYYFINNVPAGIVTVRAQYIGYAPAEARGVRVLAGQTMTVPLSLTQGAVELGVITVEAVANPIVPRDQVTSRGTITGERIVALPIDNVSQVLAFQPGVVISARGLTIRGSRPGEAAVYIDGVLVKSISGGTGAGSNTVGTNALEEASVTTGAIGAELGDAQAGVISLVTRSGGTSYRGNISYSTDEVSGETYGRGVNRVEASFGGPLMHNLTFFVATTMQGAQNGSQGLGSAAAPSYVLGGVDTVVTVARTPGLATSDSEVVAIPTFTRYSTGTRRPNQASDAWTADAKLRYTYGSGSSMSFTFHRERDQGRGNFNFNPMQARGGLNTSRAFILNWTQNLATSAERSLSIDAKLSFQRDQSLSGLMDPQWASDHRDPFGNFTFSTMKFVTNFDNFPIDDRLIENIRTNNCIESLGGRCVPFLNRNDLATSASYRWDPWGVTGFSNTGVGTGGPTMGQESRTTGSVAVDWQANRYNRLRFGGDFWHANSRSWFGGSLTNMSFLNAIIFSPTRSALFATDRLDLGDVVVDVGLRYDRLNSGIDFPEVPGRIFTDLRRSGRLDWHYPDGSNPTAHDTAVAQRCGAVNPIAGNADSNRTVWSTCNFFRADSRGVLAPSLRISFPVTDRTGFRLSYAQQVQSPDFNLLSRGVNSDLGFTNTNDIFGRDLDFGKSIQFEFGVRHAFNDDFVLDVSAYNKDKVSDFSARIVPNVDFQSVAPGGILGTNNVNMITNADFGNSRGVDVKLDRRIGSMFQGTLVYTYETAKNTGSDPFEYLNTLSRQISAVTGDRLPPAQAALTTRDNRTHNIGGSVTLNFPHDYRSGTLLGSVLRDVGMFATFRFASGLAYTRVLNAGQGSTGPGNGFGLIATGTETLNSSTMPWIKNVDLRVTRGFRIGGNRDLTVFADFRNVFNWTVLNNIYAETGDVVNDLYKQKTLQPLFDDLRNEAGNVLSTRTLNGVATEGFDLSDCSAYRPTTGSADRTSVPNCLLLRQVETRYGNGDQFFTHDEQNSAFSAYFDTFGGPWNLRAAGRNVRLGFELNF